MEDNLKEEEKMQDDQKKIEDDLKKNIKKWKSTSISNKNGRQPQAQLKKLTLIGCDIIVN